MEVTKNNFENSLDQIYSDIESSEFVSLDLEMTGINKNSSNILDTPEDRYLRGKSVAEKFKIIQIGLSFFKMVKPGVFEAKPYCFYLFPEDNSGNNIITCETGALIFNREHKMDFNKWIYDGLPYINSKHEKALIESAMEYSLNTIFEDPKKINLYKDEDRKNYEEFLSRFTYFLENKNQKSCFSPKYPRFMIAHILNNISPEIRKTLYFEYAQLEGTHTFQITKVTPEERDLLLAKEKNAKIEGIVKKKGFRNILERIQKKKIPIVGHNMLLDILFIENYLGEGLPQTLKEFKNNWLNMYGYLFDTKLIFEHIGVMTSDNSLESEKSYLENIFNILKTRNNNKIEIICGDFANESYHNAAYDAYVTGACFIYYHDILGTRLNEFSNKLHLMRSFYHSIDMNNEEKYLFPDTIIYCLRAIKQASDIDLKSVLDDVLFQKVKKVFYNESNAILILIELNTLEDINNLDERLKKFKNLFTVYSFPKFKELVNEENKKEAFGGKKR